MAAKKSAAAAPKADKAEKAESTEKTPKAEPKKKAAAKAEGTSKGGQGFAGDSKLAKFLTTNKLDARRILAASHKLETLRREDRAIKLGRLRAKGSEDAEKKAEASKQKPRSGRPVTRRAMHAAMQGGGLSGPTKTRILRAVNALLEQKKQEKVDLKALF